jgi:hypothetical protein
MPKIITMPTGLDVANDELKEAKKELRLAMEEAEDERNLTGKNQKYEGSKLQLARQAVAAAEMKISKASKPFTSTIPSFGYELDGGKKKIKKTKRKHTKRIKSTKRRKPTKRRRAGKSSRTR